MLDQVQTKRNTAAKLVYEAEVIAPGLLLDDDNRPGAQMTYKIVRQLGEKYVELAVDENAPVMPGDTIKVAVAMKSSLKTTGAALPDRPAPPGWSGHRATGGFQCQGDSQRERCRRTPRNGSRPIPSPSL